MESDYHNLPQTRFVYSTVSGPPLAKADVAALRSGSSALFLAGRLTYSGDAKGAIEFCVLFQNSVKILCPRHNGLVDDVLSPRPKGYDHASAVPALRPVLPFPELRLFFATRPEVTMANEDRLSPQVLADIEQQAQDGLHGGLLEKVWARRALALVREVRMLRERLEVAEDQDS
jgi:hypothetical protein